MVKRYRIGLIGAGGMAQAHIKQIQESGLAEIVAVSDVNLDALEKVSDQLSVVAEKRYVDFNLLLEDQDVDAVVSSTPNHVHAQVIQACLQTGKPFMAEKPFTRVFEEAKLLLELYERQPVPAMVGFSYRYTPSFRYARELVRAGEIGTVHHFSLQYLQGWGAAQYNVPYWWRFNKDITGTGTLGDLGSHMIDMARFLFGEFEELSAQLQTIIPERRDPVTGNMVTVEVDDFASFQARMTNGVMGVFQTTRNAIGSGNQHEISIYGDRGTIHVSTLEPNQLVWIAEESGQLAKTTLEVPERFKVSQWSEFLAMLEGATPDGLPDFMDGYRNQEILDAIIRANETKTVIRL